ncbi:hypothetical protein [Dyadobacter sp. CY343]|uniref:hypothetical protein n=1 Tax=Dyadobacter sp. CY343 TaxID=2907299 RepID=UPI001F2802E2|nr:hypothetical protein [Dyadobacter sp. CY343]MCE7062413.1 hypothetical protein [Dyadobacter sp. CY343]
MKLVQKLPIALSLACTMMLSSCSKEDAQMPQPQAGSVNEHSGAKTNAGELAALPAFANTISGNLGYEKLPIDWAKLDGPLTDPSIPVGLSSRTSVWGLENWSVLINPKWVKPLPPVPGNPTANSMVTVTSYAQNPEQTKDRSGVFTTLNNLKPGTTYTVTFYVASTTVTGLGSNQATSICAKYAEIKMLNVDNGSSTNAIYFYGKEATWLKKTITFKAKANSAKFVFSGLTQLGNRYSYIHLFVDRNSLKEMHVTPQMTVL